MSGVLLDPSTGRPQRRSSLTVHVPRGYEDAEPVGRCHVCELLGKETVFFAGEEQAWQRHVGECARANLDEIRARTPRARNRGGPFDPESWDPEVEEHMLEVGRRMLAEGRMEVKASERAGFS